MQVLKLIQEHNFPLPYQLGEETGYGLDGQVFFLPDHPNQVIKLCVLYDEQRQDLDQVYAQRENILLHLMEHPCPAYARVHQCAKLGEGTRTLYYGTTQRYILYYYTMERLLKLSEDEKKVFHSILSHEDRGVVKNFSSSKLKNVLAGLKMGLDFPEEQVMTFVEELKRSKVRHLDLHPRNIMRNELGDYKLIDFDRTLLKP